PARLGGQAGVADPPGAVAGHLDVGQHLRVSSGGHGLPLPAYPVIKHLPAPTTSRGAQRGDGSSRIPAPPPTRTGRAGLLPRRPAPVWRPLQGLVGEGSRASPVDLGPGRPFTTRAPGGPAGPAPGGGYQSFPRGRPSLGLHALHQVVADTPA